MQRELGPEKVREIINLWLRGDKSMGQIAVELGLSGRSIVSKKVNEERKRTPELDDLQRLNKLLIEKRVPPIDATRAANILSQVEEQGVDLGTEGIKDCLELARRYRDKTQEAIDDLLKVRALEDKERMPINKIREAADALQATLDDLRKKKQDLDREIGELEDRLELVKEYEKLKKHLDDLAIGPQEMNGFATFHRQLVEQGFTQSYATALATALKIEDLLPRDAAEVLADALVKYDSLDQAVSDLEKQKERLEIEIRPLRVERDTLESHVGSMQTHLEELVKREKSLIEIIRNLEKAKTTLEEAPASLKSIVDDAIKEIGKAPTKKMEDAIDEMSEKLRTATKEFSTAAAEVQMKAGNARDDMEDAMQKALNLGKMIGTLSQYNRLFRFMMEGVGLPEDVAPQSLEFLERLDNWQRVHIEDSSKRINLEGVIRELKLKWVKLRTER